MIRSKERVGSRALVCSKKESGMFYCPKKEKVGNTPTSEEFIRSVKRCKAKYGDKLSEKVAEMAVIIKYLARREVEVDEYNIPILNKYEANLYDDQKELLKDVDLGICLPYRSKVWNSMQQLGISGDRILARIAKEKGVKPEELNPINKFQIHSAYADSSNLNLERFLYLKEKHKRQYEGIHYGVSEIQLEGVLAYIREIELGRGVVLDKCPYNVVLNSFVDGGHAVLCIFVFDTKDAERPKLKKIVGFNSWSIFDERDASLFGCPILSLKKLLDNSRKEADVVEVTGIYYGAQQSGKNYWEDDGNCLFYTRNALHSLLRLLMDGKSCLYEVLLQGKIDPAFKLNRTLMGLLKATWFSFNQRVSAKTMLEACVKGLVLSSLLYAGFSLTYIIYMSVIVTLCVSFNLCKSELSKSSIGVMKREIQEALPQYFYEKDGQMHRKSYKKRVDSHTKDRWLTGCLEIERLSDRLNG